MNISVHSENIDRYKMQLKIEDTVHDFFREKNFLRVDTPVLSPALIPESYLEIFATEFSFFDKKQSLYLTPSPELFMKRLLAKGIGDCYYLGKAFRNAEPSSSLHSPEFTMLEFYKLHVSYMELADVVLQLLQHISQTISKTHEIMYQGKKVSCNKWEKISVAEAFKKYAEISSDTLFEETKFFKRAREKRYSIEGFTYEDVFSQIYVQEVEPHLGSNGYPTLIYNYPKQLGALAALNSDGKTAERFEFYIGGIELGDCYTELTDWKEQEERFHTQKVSHAVDKEYIKILQYGLEPCAGIAIGFDRLAMIFANASSIHDLKLIQIR